MRKALVSAAMVCVSLIVASSCPGVRAGTALAAEASKPAAKVNDYLITMGDLEGLYRAQYEIPPEEEIKENDPTVVERMSKVLDGLIERTLLDQEVKKRETVAPPQEVEERFRRFVQRFPSREAFENMLQRLGLAEADLKASLAENVRRRQLLREEVDAYITVSDDEIAAQYEEHRDLYMVPERVRARHILIVVPPNATPDQDLFARKRAEQVLSRALGGDDFGALAEKYSEDESTRPKGGDIGFFIKGSLPERLKEVEEAAFELQPGEISGLVRTTFGYHIVMVEERRPPKQSTLEEARVGVEADVRYRKWNERYREFIAALRDMAEIETYYPPE